MQSDYDRLAHRHANRIDSRRHHENAGHALLGIGGIREVIFRELAAARYLFDFRIERHARAIDDLQKICPGIRVRGRRFWQFFETKIAVLDFHRRAHMHLHTQQTVEFAVRRVVIDHDAHHMAVQKVREHVAAPMRWYSFQSPFFTNVASASLSPSVPMIRAFPSASTRLMSPRKARNVRPFSS